MSVGNLIELKGHHLAIQALSSVPNAKLTIVGSGPYKQTLMKTAADSGVLERVIFKENQSQRCLNELYQSANALILASRSEGMPNVVFEALSSGLPIIATSVGDLASDITFDLGYIVDREQGQIAKAMQKIIALPKDRKVIEQYAHERYSWKRTIESYYSILAQKFN